MRHGDKINNLSRTASHRKALLSNLANALLTNKRIITTLAKAKALRTFIEPLITKTRKNETKEQIMHNHRLVYSYLQNKEAVKELFTVIAPKVAGRPGGYTRIIKLGKRIGDNAETALIELVDFNEIYTKGTEKAAATTKRTRRAGGSRKKAAAKEETTAGEVKEEVKSETSAAQDAEEAKPE
ncbi:50S ribosomal protein L17 [Agriterribacter sp.]|uniref:50S ribosomal protein L17 n=1 Tax=Agriterribacter sp. TaxID=2821509 RepID=UPI002CEC7AA9|nr:50S ribosomal protein L17 [Agriterribacter sp.]